MRRACAAVRCEFEEANGGILRSIMALYFQISTAPLIKRLLMRTVYELRESGYEKGLIYDM